MATASQRAHSGPVAKRRKQMRYELFGSDSESEDEARGAKRRKQTRYELFGSDSESEDEADDAGTRLWWEIFGSEPESEDESEDEAAEDDEAEDDEYNRKISDPTMCMVQGYGYYGCGWYPYFTTIEEARELKRDWGTSARLFRNEEGGWDLEPDVLDNQAMLLVNGVLRCVVGFLRWARRARECAWAPGCAGAERARQSFEAGLAAM